MSDRMMTVAEAQNLVEILKSAKAGEIKLWTHEEMQLSAARTIVAQAEQIERLQAALREADWNWWDALNNEYDYTCSPEGFVSTYEALAPGDMEDPK